jgi:hypothetical protein
MTIYSSKSTRNFYDDAIVSVLPGDAFEIPQELREALLAGEVAGQIIDFDVEPPVLVNPPPPSSEALAAIEREWRDGQLAATDGVVSRHRDELEEGDATTLTPEQYRQLQQYRRSLRDWPQSGEFPLLDHRPQAPEGLAEYL